MTCSKVLRVAGPSTEIGNSPWNTGFSKEVELSSKLSRKPFLEDELCVERIWDWEDHNLFQEPKKLWKERVGELILDGDVWSIV